MGSSLGHRFGSFEVHGSRRGAPGEQRLHFGFRFGLMLLVKVNFHGPLIEFLDVYGRAVAVPFILRPDMNAEVVPSEHAEFRWIRLGEVNEYDIVPDLKMSLSLFGLRRGIHGARGPPRRRSSS